jgi:hypothetical protein
VINSTIRDKYGAITSYLKVTKSMEDEDEIFTAKKYRLSNDKCGLAKVFV